MKNKERKRNEEKENGILVMKTKKLDNRLQKMAEDLCTTHVVYRLITRDCILFGDK